MCKNNHRTKRIFRILDLFLQIGTGNVMNLPALKNNKTLFISIKNTIKLSKFKKKAIMLININKAINLIMIIIIIFIIIHFSYCYYGSFLYY